MLERAWHPCRVCYKSTSLVSSPNESRNLGWTARGFPCMLKVENHGLIPNPSCLLSPDVNCADVWLFSPSREQPCRVTLGAPDSLRNGLLNNQTPSHPGACGQGYLSKKPGKKHHIEVSVSDGRGENRTPKASEPGKASWGKFSSHSGLKTRILRSYLQKEAESHT